MATFFSKTEDKFIPPREDGNVETEPFLKAAKQIGPFIDSLGMAFKPVKSDIEGNVTRLTDRYNTNPQTFCLLHTILDDEVEKKCTEQDDSATKGLLWLKRGLQYITKLLKLIVEDHRSGAKTENMGASAREAYEGTLKNYHGWIVQQVFSVVSRAMPWRKDFLKALMVEESCTEDQVIEDMAEFTTQLDANLDAIHNMFLTMDLDFQVKV